ncbi:MAG: hypothetical protein ACLR4Z_01785 [Butyricicoccaceae bacterium]
MKHSSHAAAERPAGRDRRVRRGMKVEHVQRRPGHARGWTPRTCGIDKINLFRRAGTQSGFCLSAIHLCPHPAK